MKLMINGLPGNMAKEIISSARKINLEVFPYSLTGADVELSDFSWCEISFQLLKPDQRDEVFQSLNIQHQEVIAIDFTHPSAVNENARFYIRHGIPFVMGTTGGDRELLLQEVKAANHYAVIAPNMAKQIVAFQAMFSQMAEQFPGVLKGYQLEVKESHQKQKADTSGTAKALVSYFQNMGISYMQEQIVKVRDEKSQMEIMKVPEEHLSGHAFHTYHISSADQMVHFEFQHNVCGRSVYAEGTIDAALYLNHAIQKKETGQTLFDMVDVLKAGAMR